MAICFSAAHFVNMENRRLKSGIKKLEKENERLRVEIAARQETNETLVNKLWSLRDALEFYADYKNYDKQGVCVDVQDDGNGEPEWFQEVGDRARKALATSKG